MKNFGRYAMAPEGDEGSGGALPPAGAPPPAADVVSRAEHEALAARYSAMVAKDEAAKRAAEVADAVDSGKTAEALKKLADDNKALSDRLAAYSANDEAEADRLFVSLPEDAQKRFGGLKDNLGSAAWLQFLRKEAPAHVAIDDDDDDDNQEPGLQQRTPKRGKKSKKLYSEDAIDALEDDLGRETEYLPHMNIERDDRKGSVYSLGKKAWVNSIKGKTLSAVPMTSDVARQMLRTGRDTNTREALDKNGAPKSKRK